MPENASPQRRTSEFKLYVHMEATDEKTLDVRPIPPKDKHPTIFETFDELALGESFVLVNDHDPKPLYYQFEAERPGEMAWEYLEEGPEVWRVRLTKSEDGSQ